jgi:hypothetical protein
MKLFMKIIMYKVKMVTFDLGVTLLFWRWSIIDNQTWKEHLILNDLALNMVKY